MMTCKGCGRKRPWSTWTYYSGVCLDRLKQTIKSQLQKAVWGSRFEPDTTRIQRTGNKVWGVTSGVKKKNYQVQSRTYRCLPSNAVVKSMETNTRVDISPSYRPGFAAREEKTGRQAPLTSTIQDREIETEWPFPRVSRGNCNFRNTCFRNIRWWTKV